MRFGQGQLAVDSGKVKSGQSLSYLLTRRHWPRTRGHAAANSRKHGTSAT